jgi:hypothetical protein
VTNRDAAQLPGFSGPGGRGQGSSHHWTSRAFQTVERGRPWPLTLLCLTGALLVGWSWWHGLRGEVARAFGPGYWAYLGVTTGALSAALWGIWRLRPWARWALPAALLIDDAVVAAMGELRPLVLGLQLVVVLVVLSQGRAMRPAPDGEDEAPASSRSS